MVLSNDNVTQSALLSQGRLGFQGIVDILGMARNGIGYCEEARNRIIDLLSKLAWIGSVA